jgi:type IV pilus assembly protein PilE
MYNDKAVTLIELLVVVLIIGILAAIALPQYQKAVEKSRAAEALSVMRTIKDAEEVYYLTHGEYTADFGNLDIDYGIKISSDKVNGRSFRFILQATAYGIFIEAWHLRGPFGYWLSYIFDKSKYGSNLKGGGFYCSAMTKKDEELCEALGGVFIAADGTHKRYKI